MLLNKIANLQPGEGVHLDSNRVQVSYLQLPRPGQAKVHKPIPRAKAPCGPQPRNHPLSVQLALKALQALDWHPITKGKGFSEVEEGSAVYFN